MNYVYDITVNLKEKYLDFFEWNKSDNIKCIHKLPIVKVSDRIIFDFMFGDIIINQKIKDGFYLLFSDNQAMVVNVVNSKVISKSSLVVDEELDILENYDNISKQEIEYNIHHIMIPTFKTRLESNEYSFVSNELDRLSIPRDSQMINYLYLECFGRIETNSDKALLCIKKNLGHKVSISKISKIIKLIHQK